MAPRFVRGTQDVSSHWQVKDLKTGKLGPVITAGLSGSDIDLSIDHDSGAEKMFRVEDNGGAITISDVTYVDANTISLSLASESSGSVTVILLMVRWRTWRPPMPRLL